MDNIDLVRQLLDNIRGSLEAIDKLLPVGTTNSQPLELVQTEEQEPQVELPKLALGTIASSLSLDQLGPTPDIYDVEWPDAVAEHMIVKESDEDTLRLKAIQVQGAIGVNPVGIKVLDFGSGTGHIAAQYAKDSITYAYDINKKAAIYNDSNKDYQPITSDQWDGFSKENYGQLDLIILYDVLDHIVGATTIDVLSSLRKLLAPSGNIFIRCHPWTSRTGGHLYMQHNKAFLHLALTPEELLANGLRCEPNIKTNKPLAAYEHIINKAGLKTVSKKVHTNPIESYVADNLLPRIIKTTWSGKITEEKAAKIMTTTNVDYLLSL